MAQGSVGDSLRRKAQDKDAEAATGHVELPRWARLIKEAYGLYMDGDKARFWGEELRRPSPEGVGSISDDEIENAVRFLRVKAARDEKARAKSGFSLDTLIMAVRWMRKESAEREGRGVDQAQFRGTLDGYKDRMMREPYIDERWHILCSAPSKFCQDLDMWAETEWGDEWRNTRTKLRREFAAGMREVIGKIRWAV